MNVLRKRVITRTRVAAAVSSVLQRKISNCCVTQAGGQVKKRGGTHSGGVIRITSTRRRADGTRGGRKCKTDKRESYRGERETARNG